MKPWRQVGETETVYDGWRKVFRKAFITNSGKEFVAEISGKDGTRAAAVIALTRENRVVVARQFRVGPMQVMDELPGGMVEPGEDPTDAVIRELREETGYEIGNITKVGEVFKSSYIASKWHYYLAEGCYVGEAGLHHDEGEEIEVDTISITELLANAKGGRFTDIEAVLFAYEQLRELEGVK